MKLFFGGALDEMVRELRGQGAPMVRVHVLPEMDGRVLRLATHVTTICNAQIYEAVVETTADLPQAQAEQMGSFIRQKSAEARDAVVKKLDGFEVRPGVLRE